MLHILLGILKIIGILIAVILGLILLIVCIVFFAALRYEIKAATDGDIKKLEANVKFFWLFHLVSGFVTYKEQNLDWQVKIAWKKLNVDKTAEVTVEKEDPDLVEVQKQPAAEAQPDIRPQPKVVVKETVVKDKLVNKEEPKKKAEKRADKKAKEKKQSIFDKLKEIKEQKDAIIAFIKAEKHKMALQKLMKELFSLLKKLKPKKLKANIEFGMEDPYKTGSILAYASILYPFYGDNISITPNFEEVILKGDIFIKGHLRVFYFVNMGIRLLLDKNIRLTIKDTKKLIAKK